jgi:hypothetical protein
VGRGAGVGRGCVGRGLATGLGLGRPGCPSRANSAHLRRSTTRPTPRTTPAPPTTGIAVTEPIRPPHPPPNSRSQAFPPSNPSAARLSRRRTHPPPDAPATELHHPQPSTPRRHQSHSRRTATTDPIRPPPAPPNPTAPAFNPGTITNPIPDRTAHRPHLLSARHPSPNASAARHPSPNPSAAGHSPPNPNHPVANPIAIANLAATRAFTRPGCNPAVHSVLLGLARCAEVGQLGLDRPFGRSPQRLVHVLVHQFHYLAGRGRRAQFP